MKQKTSISTTFELQFLRIIIRYTLSSVFVIKIISLCTDMCFLSQINQIQQWDAIAKWDLSQRYTYGVLQTIQMKFIPLSVWAELVILGSAKTALKFKYEI